MNNGSSVNWILCMMLVLAHILWSWLSQDDNISHPYIPPLTHTPGMGISSIAQPQPPLWLLIQNRPPHIACSDCDRLFQERTDYLFQGKNFRISIQEQIPKLLNELPPNIFEEARVERGQNERTLGEVKIWTELQEYYSTN